MDEVIPKEDLIIGAAYQGDGRNFDVAIWSGLAFWGLRQKFGRMYMDEEVHYDEGPPHGTFKPLKRIDDAK